jgi:hypothetical protein
LGYPGFPENRQTECWRFYKLLKKKLPGNGSRIATTKVPVMYRLLELRPASPKKSRRPARASAIKAALQKGNYRQGQSAVGTAGKSAVHHMIWEASDQRRTAKTPFHSEWRFLHLAPKWAKVPAKYTCQPWRFTVVSDLPIKRLMRATRDG